MDPQRQRIQEDLRGLLQGDVLCDDVTLALYSGDASLFQIKPLGVIRPRTTADVSAVLKYAYEHEIAVHARGAGTGLAGESLGPGLIVDFSRYMRRILHTADDHVRIQPGVVHARLNEHLRGYGKIFGPDPAMSQVTTMGSVIAIDNSGSHFLVYGSARRHVRELEIVLADGTILRVGRETIPNDPPGESADSAELRKRDITLQLAALVRDHREMIDRHRPRTLVNRSGYELHSLIEGPTLNWPRLLCGSEGTLALITEATVDIQPFPKHKSAALLLFHSLEQAVLAIPELLKLGPCALDLLDRRHLSLACEAEPRYSALIPHETECLLLIEFAGEELRPQQDRIRQAVETAVRKLSLSFAARVAADLEELRFFWRLPRRIMPTLQRTRGSARPVPFVEDIAVPPQSLAEFFPRLQKVLKQHQVSASLYGHVGHGQLHLRPFLDLTQPADVAKLAPLAEDIYEQTLAVGGTISGEHGDGLSRTPYVARQYAELYPVLAQVKRIFDPQGILNPGKIIALDDGATINTYLRANRLHVRDARDPTPLDNSETTTPATVDLQLTWRAADVLSEAQDCNGCGLCRTQLAEHRMCPIFRTGPAEEASPRAKANLLRGVVTGELDPQLLTQTALKEVADLCVHCHQCRLECPGNVDIPKLMLEAKAGYTAVNGLRPGEWVLANLDRVSRWASRAPRVAGWLLGNRQIRWLLERTLGLAHARKLPKPARMSFPRWAARRGLNKPPRRGERKVLYFADTAVNYYDPQLGQALVAILEHHQVGVYVPAEPLHAGMPLITAGAIEPARRLLAKNIPLLAEAVRQGYTILCSEPSTLLCLTHEYLHLSDDEEVRLVAQHTIDAMEYLWKLHQHGDLQLDLRPIHAVVGYHQPCHARATQTGSPGESLLRLIAGLQVVRLDRGCSGMAGTYGLKKEHFRDSLRAGRPLIDGFRDPVLQAGATECTACKMQLEQGADKTTLHPLKWLAAAYDLIPEAAEIRMHGGERLPATNRGQAW